eukprot:CAMPEP_0178781874 /NCGR_PEP_ID=MMETSP0745-20121128/2840_1 /TAXON_ID=913974 /ORGANISM="Nitzschia punctata, Strain CCMP561" /LENGTH=113 /DNA_ID=CAMNT_0020439259 /DNA_START=67 /DNA_END=408 /DNA_ORIENTATION=-
MTSMMTGFVTPIKSVSEPSESCSLTPPPLKRQMVLNEDGQQQRRSNSAHRHAGAIQIYHRVPLHSIIPSAILIPDVVGESMRGKRRDPSSAPRLSLKCRASRKNHDKKAEYDK